jgi:hypothetical protein
VAGDWLKMEASTPEKEEVLAITSRLGWDDADLTVGKLFRLWRWFDQHTVNGNAARVTPALLDRIVGVTGFCDAVREVGWLQVDDSGITLPKFDRHNGKSAKSRALTAKRVAKHKAGGDEGNDDGNAASVSGALPREEKREEKKGSPPSPRKRGRESERFTEFWLAWPKNERKQDKAKCAEHWQRHSLDAQADAIVADVRTKRGTQKWRDGFIEAPLVYLRGRRWLDGVTPNEGPTAAAVDWRATWKSIVAKGEEIGVGAWSEEAWHAGKATDFPTYRAKVERRVAELEHGQADPHGQKKIADLVGGLINTKQKETST